MNSSQNLFLAVILAAAIAVTVQGHNGHEDIVHTSCVHASYPTLCVRTLSTYSGPTITNGRDLAMAAVKISISHAQTAAGKLKTLRNSIVSGKKRERSAMVDCVEQMGNSVDELSRTLGVLKHLRVLGGASKEFRWELSNAETWTSAALTNEDTCLEGFQDIEGELKTEVKQKITKVARVTSNALYMINQLEDTRGKRNVVHS